MHDMSNENIKIYRASQFFSTDKLHLCLLKCGWMRNGSVGNLLINVWNAFSITFTINSSVREKFILHWIVPLLLSWSLLLTIVFF